MTSKEVLEDMLNDAEREVEVLKQRETESDKALSDVLLRLIALEGYVSDVKTLTAEAINKLKIMQLNNNFNDEKEALKQEVVNNYLEKINKE